jgi:hypothetical protein
MTLNWWINMLVLLCISCVRGSTGHVSSRHLSSGFKTVRLPTCILHKRGPWPPRSPNLSRTDFFVVFLKIQLVQKQSIFS